MTAENYTFATLEQFVGQELGVSEWFQIDQQRINDFADATGDHQWIHIDAERAAASPMGTTIAHGYLTMSLLPLLMGEIGTMPSGVAHVLNYGADKLRFMNFVKVNQRVRNRAKLISAKPKSGGMLLKIENTMEIEGEEKPAMVAETLSLAFPA
ncbi:MAG: MaoC family dehydratase [Candidatus Promineifilaceae bacterium]